jgi:hypothetical protein
MKQVELIRQRVIRGQQAELARLRQFLSMTDNSPAALEGKDMDRLMVEIVDTILKHIGVEVGKPKDGRTRTAKAL